MKRKVALFVVSALIPQEMALISEEVFQQFTDAQMDELACRTGCIRRKRKIGAKEWLLLSVWMGKNIANLSLRSFCSHFTELTKIPITPEGLNQRFNSNSVAFLEAVLAQLLETKTSQSFGDLTRYRSIFSRIRILDSTAFQLPDRFSLAFPGTGCTSVKFQVEFDVLSGRFLHAHFEPGRVHDSCTGTGLKDTIQEKDLILRDLGYLDLGGLEKLNEAGDRYFISRLRGNAQIYEKNPHPAYFKTGKMKKKTEYLAHSARELAEVVLEGETKEFEGLFVGKKEVKFPVRLIIHHFSPAHQKERQERLAEEERVKGVRYSEQAKQMSAYGLFITNLPIQVSTEEIHQLYSIRWQIELLFKSWKSTLQLTACKPIKLERLLCHFYGQLITMILCTMVTYRMRYALWQKEQGLDSKNRKKRELSEMKSFRTVKETLLSFYFACQKNTREVAARLLHLFHRLERDGLKSHKKGKPTFQQLIGVLT